MENKHFFRVLPLAALALMMGACGNDEMENGMKDHVAGEFVPMTFTASMDTDADTRTSLENGTNVYWNGGDNIIVFTETEVSTSDFEKYKFVSNLEEGTKAPNTQFTGMVPEADAYYAFYPFEKVTQYRGKDKGIYFTFPVEQNAVPGGFESGLNVSVAKAENGNKDLSFKNLCALVKFKLDGDAAESIKCVELKNDGNISGNLRVKWDPSEEDKPQVFSTKTSTSIKLVGEFKRGEDYYFVVAVPTTGSVLEYGFSLTFTMEGDATRTKTSKGLSKPLLAGTILDLGTITLENETYTESINNLELIEAIETWTSVIFDKDNEGNVPLTPTNKEIIEGITELSIEYENIPDFKGIEHFTNLENLYCIDCNIESLDVSNLKNLKILSCKSNKITELNVQDLENLEVLNCMSNRLSILDVSKNLNLKDISCGYQQKVEGGDQTLQLLFAPSFQSIWDRIGNDPQKNGNVNGQPIQE